MTPTPRTNDTIDTILDEHGELTERTAPRQLVQLARQLERELIELQANYYADMAMMNERLIERTTAYMDKLEELKGAKP